MKKLLTIVLAAIFIFSLSASAFAAQTFSDVPPGHWAYAAVAKLAKAGIIDGYGDGTFRGDRPMNRFEFATATVRALDKFDKADDEQKQLIDKLSAEFAAELNRMGARIAKVEAKTNTWLLGGDARFRYHTDHPSYPNGSKLAGSNTTDWRARLKFSGNINDNTVVQGRISTIYGNNFGNTSADSGAPGSTAYFDTFNVTSKNALGLDSIRLGRSALDFIGSGLIGKPVDADGVTLYKTMGDVKFTGFTGNIKDATGTIESNQLTTAQVGFKVSNDLKMGVGYYWADIPGVSGTPVSILGTVGSFTQSKGYDVSLKYKVGGGLTLLGDYIGTTLVNPVNIPGSPKGWSVQLSNGTGPGATMAYYPTSWQLVQPTKIGNSAWAIIYRSVDPGAIPNGAGGFDTTAIANATGPYNLYLHGTDNQKTLYLVYQTVVDKNVVLSFEWQDAKVKNRSIAPALTSDSLDKTFMTKIDCYF